VTEPEPEARTKSTRRPLKALVAAVVVASVAGCSGDGRARFAYDASAPLAARSSAAVGRGRITIQQVSFRVENRRLHGLLALPETARPAPGVLLSPEGVRDRESLGEEASALARHGLVALAVDGPWAATGVSWPTCGDRDYGLSRWSVIALRRALDFLQHRAEVDADRLGVAGFSYSAWTVGVLSAVDDRPRALVLESGEATMTRFLEETCGATSGRYLARMAVFDPIDYVRRAKKPILFQNARHDEFWPLREMRRLAAAAPNGEVRWYDATHDLNAQAVGDRVAWLVDHLER
jgi:dienelactone hydrolase